MAALLHDELDVEATLVKGDRGELSIWVGDLKVAEKTQLGFPDERDILHAVEAALEGSG